VADSAGKPPVPLSAAQKAARASSFGGVAAHYERYRPGPPAEALDFIVPRRVALAVDLGAGTGALARLLLHRATEVVAVEPDDRMRAVLIESVPGVRAVVGRGESIPLPDASADVVVASSSWHWMDPVPTLLEVGRVLVPGGTLGALWSGPDPDSPFVAQARALLGLGGEQARDEEDGRQGELARVIGGLQGAEQVLEIPGGLPFGPPEHAVVQWDVALNADELIGLLGTFSWVILMDDASRVRLLDTARRLLREALGVEGDVTVEVGYRADAWRARRLR